MADEHVYMEICLEISSHDLFAFVPAEPAETRLYRLALTRGLLPDHMYMVMPVQGREAVKIRQVVSNLSKVG